MAFTQERPTAMWRTLSKESISRLNAPRPDCNTAEEISDNRQDFKSKASQTGTGWVVCVNPSQTAQGGAGDSAVGLGDPALLLDVRAIRADAVRETPLR